MSAVLVDEPGGETRMARITKTQRETLTRIATLDNGERTPFVGGREAGRIASGWYRTAYALDRAGLVTMKQEGDAYRIRITHAGRLAIAPPTP